MRAKAIIAGQVLEYAKAVTSTGTVYWWNWNQDSNGTDFTHDGTKFQLVHKNGDVYRFTPHAALTNTTMSGGTQVLERIDYADGTRQDYSYDSSGRLRTLISSRGYAIVLDYNSNGKIAAACGYNLTLQTVNSNTTCSSASLKVSYGYTPRATSSGTSYDLTSVTDALGGVTALQYTSSGYLSCIVPAGTTACQMTTYYGPQTGDPSTLATPRQVRKQVTAAGETWLFSYDFDYDNEVPLQPGETRYTWSYMTDPAGNTSSVRYANKVADQHYEPSGIPGQQRLTQYKFDGSVPLKFTLPEDNIVDLYRDNRQNLLKTTRKAKPGTGLPDIVTEADYPPVRYDPPDAYTRPVGCQATSQKLCDKPTWVEDAKDNRTDFTYDPAHGGVLTETSPAVNGIRAQKRYTYAQRYAWISNGAGGFVQAASPVWLLNSMSFCRTSAATGTPSAPCSTAGDEVLTTYDYGPDSGPNNLLLRGTVVTADGQSVRTCQSYDAQGNKISETGAGANLTSCN
jgi:YD repeat-containing protein